MVVNTPSSQGAIGLTTNLAPALTLGCGTLGGNITSDNITPRHLMHVKRVARGRAQVTPDRAECPAAGNADRQRAVAADPLLVEKIVREVLRELGEGAS